MTSTIIPVIATLILWWASTGLILYLDSLDRRTYAASMAAATGVLVAAVWALTRWSEATVEGAYVAFTAGLMIWAWQLVTFYFGYITGPRKTACPPGLEGWPRFVEATRVSIHHELASLLGAGALFALSYHWPNKLGLWTYVVLWWMHQSAKINVFLGVPNHGEDMLPDHLRFVVSFMKRRPMNLFFPISVTVSTVLAVLLAQKAIEAGATPFDTVAYSMLATLMGLAILEHWFLVAPIDGNALWRPVKHETPAPEETDVVVASAAISRTLEDSDYSRPRGGHGGLESWGANPPPLCDETRLSAVLDSIRSGAFGDIDFIKGVVRTGASWVRFEISPRDKTFARFAPEKVTEPLVVATGRSLDKVRLKAAFDACAAMG